MNAAVIELLGSVLPSDVTGSDKFVNSLTSSSTGDVAFLSEDGKVRLCNMRSQEKATLSVLSIYGVSPEEISVFENLEFSSDGRSLLLWGASRAGVIEMPATVGGICTYSNILSIGAMEDGPCYPIAKASFHPLCNHCVVLLHQQEALRLVDLRSMNSQVIALSPGRSFASYTFGPAIDWLRFTIVLLAANGDLFNVCPVIPTGTVVPASVVGELSSWLDQVEYDNTEYAFSDEYVSNLREFLRATFGPRPLPQEAPRFVRAGEVGERTSFPGDNDADLDQDRALCVIPNYVPMVTGPLPIQRSAAEEGVDEPGRSTTGVRACDICTPGAGIGSDGSAASVQVGAPIVAIAYATGKVEICLLDPASQVPSARAAAVVRSASYNGPCWRPIDRSRPALVCSTCGVVVAETVSLRAPERAAAAGVAEEGSQWRIEADPVFGHLLHVSCPAHCEAHLLSVQWLERALDEETRRSFLSVDSPVDGESVDHEVDGASPAAFPTRVLPTFALPPTSGEAAGKGTAESKSGRPDGTAALSGMVVVQDAMLGHVALFRTSTGVVSAVNLTVHTKLCELQDSISGHQAAPDLLPLKEELGKATSAEHVRWRRAQQCVQKVAEGLRAMPELDAATAAGLTPQASPHNKKVLLDAAQKLEREVLVPLNELAQTTLFSYEMVQEAYRTQVEILEGIPEGAGRGAAGPLSKGLCNLLVDLGAENDALAERVRKIQEKFALQKEKAEQFLQFAVSQRAKVSRAETAYKRQLEDWSHVVGQMNEQVNALRVLSGTTSATSTPAPSAAASPRRAQPPLFSTTTTNSATFGSPSPAMSRFRSPGLPAPTPATPGGVVQSPTPSKGAGSRAVAFQTPQTPGAFKSAAGQLYRPHSTPSTTTPASVRTAAAMATPASVTASAGPAGLGRQYHTRHPPLATSSPNFFADYRASAAAQRTVTSDSGDSAVGATDGTARSSRTAGPSQLGSPPPSAGSRPEPAVTLSEADQEACTQLLRSQTELLEKAKSELVELEGKLRALRELRG